MLELNATLLVAPLQIVCGDAEPEGTALTVIEVVVINAGQGADAAMVYVTVYVPGVLVPNVTSPVDTLIDNPAGLAVYVPPGVPVRVTVAVPAF